ncbi:hypothetical protein [Pelagibacterium montanilacus]|uniref:hypothetical protein n=1 Tax=Pelagibacterium montanilacus TaxID=2185280 RepID=UPI000F8DE857|nr:hypothetical protein [Pelagibacterium montanilacus]
MSEPAFVIAAPQFDPARGLASFTYHLGAHSFTETLALPTGADSHAQAHAPEFARLLDLAAAVLGVSYYKLRAPFTIDLSALTLAAEDRAFLLDVYENGLGEFFARNDLKRFGQIALVGTFDAAPLEPLKGPERALILIGGGKDSLVSLDLVERAGLDFALFAVNPKGPILSSAERSGRELIAATRTLDPEMIRLGKEPGYFNGHVPSTAINSVIAALAAQLLGYGAIVLSNERSASEGNLDFDGRQANHQHSKSLDFEGAMQSALSRASAGKLAYFSLLRPYSEARIAALFARSTRFDDVFSSCNRNFRLSGHDGVLWCGACPKCHFVFLIFAPVMPRDRLVAIFGQNVLDNPANIAPYRELTGLAGHKPWECVGEILEAAACLHQIAGHPDWRDTAVVSALRDELVAFYGTERLEAAYAELLQDSPAHLIPDEIAARIAPHAH